MNKPALAADVAPTEDDSIDFVYKTELRFGFEYCNFVLDRLEQQIYDRVLNMLVMDDILDDQSLVEADDATDADETISSTLMCHLLI